MSTYISISMYPNYAFIHIHIRNEFGYKFSSCEQVSKEKAFEVSMEFNVPIN